MCLTKSGTRAIIRKITEVDFGKEYGPKIF